MALKNFSKFYYGYEISSRNNVINFLEPNGANIELEALLNPGNFTLTQTIINIKTVMDAVGENTYTVTVDRDTRLITIAADGDFNLLTNTGSGVGLSPWPLLGFDQTADYTGLATYTGNTPSGKEYVPQFRLQDYISAPTSQERIDASINESASGQIETVFFGTRNFVEFSLSFITDRDMGGDPFYTNPTGLDDAVDFLDYLSTKGGFEFMPDKNITGTFVPLLVEKMPGGPKGVGFQLTELHTKNLPDIYEIKKIRCRVIT